MPFKMPSFDIHFGNIVRAYLSTAAAVTAGMPPVTGAGSVPRVAVYDNKAKTFPIFVVAGATQPQGPRHQRITVAVGLHYQPPAEDADDTRATYAEWMKAANDHLRNHSALYAFIAALPEEQRTGWNLRRVYPGIVGVSQEIKDRGEVIPTSIDFDIRLPAQS